MGYSRFFQKVEDIKMEVKSENKEFHKKLDELKFELSFIRREMNIAIKLLKDGNKESGIIKLERIEEMMSINPKGMKI